MSRKEELNSKLKMIIHNQKCSHNNLIPTLEACENQLINTVFEETHGEKLYLDHVISHLKNLSIEKELDNCPEVVTMIDNLISFKRFIKDLKKGSKGERFARNALNKLSIPCSILENIQLSYGDTTTEGDVIVIAKNGVFIIEVKYSDNDMCITRDGFYVPANNQVVSLGARNVLEQIANERYVVANVLSEKLGIQDIQSLQDKIHSVILFANNKKRLYDQSLSENVLYCYNISSYISTFDNGIVLTQDEINDYLSDLQNNSENTEYTIDFDLDALRESFVEGLCMLENVESLSSASTKQQPTENTISEKSTKKRWKFDWISAGIGGLATGLGFACYKCYTIAKTA